MGLMFLLMIFKVSFGKSHSFDQLSFFSVLLIMISFSYLYLNLLILWSKFLTCFKSFTVLIFLLLRISSTIKVFVNSKLSRTETTMNSEPSSFSCYLYLIKYRGSSFCCKKASVLFTFLIFSISSDISFYLFLYNILKTCANYDTTSPDCSSVGS